MAELKPIIEILDATADALAAFAVEIDKAASASAVREARWRAGCIATMSIEDLREFAAQAVMGEVIGTSLATHAAAMGAQAITCARMEHQNSVRLATLSATSGRQNLDAARRLTLTAIAAMTPPATMKKD